LSCGGIAQCARHEDVVNSRSEFFRELPRGTKIPGGANGTGTFLTTEQEICSATNANTFASIGPPVCNVSVTG
jgi:hypothetical protein